MGSYWTINTSFHFISCSVMPPQVIPPLRSGGALLRYSFTRVGQKQNKKMAWKLPGFEKEATGHALIGNEATFPNLLSLFTLCQSCSFMGLFHFILWKNTPKSLLLICTFSCTSPMHFSSHPSIITHFPHIFYVKCILMCVLFLHWNCIAKSGDMHGPPGSCIPISKETLKCWRGLIHHRKWDEQFFYLFSLSWSQWHHQEMGV